MENQNTYPYNVDIVVLRCAPYIYIVHHWYNWYQWIQQCCNHKLNRKQINFIGKILSFDYLCNLDDFWIHLDKLDIAIRIHWSCMDIGHLSCYKPNLLNQYHRNYKLKIKEFKFCYFFCRENVITVIFTVGKSKMKVQAIVTMSHFNPPMPHVQWHWPLASHPLVELVIDPSGLQLQSSIRMNWNFKCQNGLI